MDFSWEQEVAALRGRKAALRGRKDVHLGARGRHTRIFWDKSRGFGGFWTPVTKMKLTTPLMMTKLSIGTKLVRLMESPFNLSFFQLVQLERNYLNLWEKF